MFNGKQRRPDNVDSVARDITRAAAPGDEELDTMITSPLFWSSLSARIEREQRGRRRAPSRPVSSPIFVGKLKMAASTLMIVAAVGFWLLRVLPGSGQAARSSQAQPAPGLTACSLSATSACAITTGDVLQLLLSDNSQELPK